MEKGEAEEKGGEGGGGGEPIGIVARDYAYVIVFYLQICYDKLYNRYHYVYASLDPEEPIASKNG